MFAFCKRKMIYKLIILHIKCNARMAYGFFFWMRSKAIVAHQLQIVASFIQGNKSFRPFIDVHILASSMHIAHWTFQ